MSPHEAKNAEGSARLPLSVPQWVGAHALKLIHGFNERLLEVLVGYAQDGRETAAPEVVRHYRSLWCACDAAARRRAARFPVLLVDLHFQDECLWRDAGSGRSGRWRDPGSHSCFPGKYAGELAREALTLAWHIARVDRGAACLLLGMSSEVSTLIAGLSPSELSRIAAKHSRQLRLRWEDLRPFWRNLLVAAHRDDRESLYKLHLHSFQLLGSELIPLCN